MDKDLQELPELDRLSESEICEFGRFQLDRSQGALMLDGEPVRIPKKTFELLTYLVENPNRIVDKTELLNEVWPGSFVEEANLTVHISNLRKVFNGHPDLKIETFPKVGYRFKAEVTIGRISTAEPLSDISVGSRSGQVPPSTYGRKKPLWAVLAVIALLSAVTAAVYLVDQRDRPPITSVAVLPFLNATGSPDNDYLSDGMTDMLIRQLSQQGRLPVTASTSVSRYRGEGVDPVKAGTDLAAEAVVRARMSHVEEAFVFDAEIVDVATGNVVWTDRFSSSSGELAPLINKMADGILSSLNAYKAERTSSSSSDLRSVHNDAYLYYLKGRHHWSRRNNAEFRKAIEYFQRSIEAEPDFALAYSGLSDSYVLLIQFGGAAPSDVLSQARSAAQKAAQLDGDCAEAHASLGNVAFLEKDKERAALHFRKAIELDPNYATALQWLAELLSESGQTDEADVLIRRAIELDPLSRIIRHIEARNQFWGGNPDKAIQLLKRNIDLDPTWGGDHDLLFHVYEAKGMYQEAIEAYLQAQALILDNGEESDVDRTRAAAQKGGWLGFIRHRLNHLESRSKRRYVKPQVLAEFYSRLGDVDKAFELLEKAQSNGTLGFSWVERLSCYNSLRADPRYEQLRQRAKLNKI
jgi:DNA-binding winged helix-turn-helix (wHTH) protein/TolB-like protein